MTMLSSYRRPSPSHVNSHCSAFVAAPAKPSCALRASSAHGSADLSMYAPCHVVSRCASQHNLTHCVANVRYLCKCIVSCGLGTKTPEPLRRQYSQACSRALRISDGSVLYRKHSIRFCLCSAHHREKQQLVYVFLVPFSRLSSDACHSTPAMIRFHAYPRQTQ
jgi:hypothetical protein